MKYRCTRTCLPAIMFGSGYDCLLPYRSSLSQTFCGSLNNSGGSCSAAGTAAAAVARGSCHQGARVAGRSSGRDRLRSLARNEQCCGVAS